MVAQNPVFLVGLMGSGKTTVGKKLSSFLGYDFVDIDQALMSCQIAKRRLFLPVAAL